MPNEIIHAVHRLAAACKKYKGIVFTDSKGKIIDDDSPVDETEISKITEITGVGITGVGHTNNIADVNSNTIGHTNNIAVVNRNTTHETTNTDSIAGVDETINLGNPLGNTDNTPINNHIYNNVQDETGEPDQSETHTTQEDDNNNDHVYEGPTRHEMEMIEEMNTTNMRQDMEHTSENVDMINEANDEVMEEAHPETGNNTTHGYNLRPRPTRRSEKISLMQTTRQSTCKVTGEKPHLHVMMTQMSVKAGIKMFGENGNEAVSKELRQLHDRKAMVPVSKDEMSPEDRKKP